jgi:hypothetical protein
MSKLSTWRAPEPVTSRRARTTTVADAPGWLLPGAGQNLQNLHWAVARCRQLILAARNLRKFPGGLWTAEAKKWPTYRSQVDRGLLECREVGLTDGDLGELLLSIETLDVEWSSASELRDRAATAPADVPAGYVASCAKVAPRHLPSGPELDEAIRVALSQVVRDQRTRSEDNLTGKGHAGDEHPRSSGHRDDQAIAARGRAHR